METLSGQAVMLFETAKDWESWLDGHCLEQEGVWLKVAKKNSGSVSVTYFEALDAALCYGWIDGQKRSYDERYFLQKFTPRRPRSIWSKINVEKVARLTSAGKMKPSGLAAVEAAKADGRWERAYDSHSTAEMPADFRLLLEANPKAKAFFEGLNKTNRYAVLWRIQTAAKPEVRIARMEKIVGMLEEGKAFHTSDSLNEAETRHPLR